MMTHIRRKSRFVKVRRDLTTQVMSIGMRHERWRAGTNVAEGTCDLARAA
jgi:hypothetical protein